MKKLLLVLMYVITFHINCAYHTENNCLTSISTVQNQYDTLLNTHYSKETKQDLLNKALFSNNIQSASDLLHIYNVPITMDGPYPTLRFARTINTVQLLCDKMGYETMLHNTYFSHYHFFTLVKPHYDATLIPFFSFYGFSAHEIDHFGNTPLTHLIAIAENYRGKEDSLIQKAHNLLDIHSPQQMISLAHNTAFKRLTTPPHTPLKALIISQVHNRLAKTLSSSHS